MISTTPLARRGKPSRVGRSRWGVERVSAARNVSLVGAIMTKTGPLLRGSVARGCRHPGDQDYTVKTVQKAADIAVRTGNRLYTDSASSYQALQGYAHAWSCTCILRVIPNARESGTIPPFPTCVRGNCHAIQHRFLPAWADRPDMGVPDAVRAVAIGTCCNSTDTTRASHATP